MSRQLWLADVIADAFRGVSGFKVETWHGWTSLGREGFEPRGLLDHHTGSGGSYDNILRYMMDSSPLRPSCNWATSPPINGVVRITITCAGSANHAGQGSLPWVPTNTGNYHLIGGEHHNDGYTPWPQQQREAIEIADAAMLRYLGHDVDRVAFHKTYAGYRGKWDMHTLDLADHQRRIHAHLSAPAPAPSTYYPEDDRMYPEMIIAAYDRARGTGKGQPYYDVRQRDTAGWRSWLEHLAKVDVQKRDTPSAKLDVVRTCEYLLSLEGR